ncbi:MAG: hypothetical protein ACOC91_01615 [bacterium]
MKFGEAVRLTSAWIAGILLLLAVGGAMIYGTWWVVAGKFREPPQTAAPRHYVIGLDLSQGNPLVISDVFSGKAGRRIAAMITDLPMRSKVTLRTFGSYSVNANPLQFDRVISRRHPPDQVREIVKGIVSGVPKLITDGRLKTQQQSNIMAFLLNMAQITDCSAAKTTVVLVTDGLEASEVARLNGGDDGLPPPPSALFEGCRRLEILGLGQGLASVEETRRLRQIWQEWATQAGFQSFRGLNDW